LRGRRKSCWTCSFNRCADKVLGAPQAKTACEADLPRTPHTAALEGAVSDTAVLGTVAKLEKQADLRGKGVITHEAYEAKKDLLGK
jgi:hypothetical protein